jgi:hypothetical protein
MSESFYLKKEFKAVNYFPYFEPKKTAALIYLYPKGLKLRYGNQENLSMSSTVQKLPTINM